MWPTPYVRVYVAYRCVCLLGIHLQPLYWLDGVRHLFSLGPEGLAKGWRGVPPGAEEEGKGQPSVKATLSWQARWHAPATSDQVVVQATEGGLAWALELTQGSGSKDSWHSVGAISGSSAGQSFAQVTLSSLSGSLV